MNKNIFLSESSDQISCPFKYPSFARLDESVQVKQQIMLSYFFKTVDSRKILPGRKRVFSKLLLCLALLGSHSIMRAQTELANFKIPNIKKSDAPYPPDISFCIVDLKYKKPHLKICEFGEGVISGFYGYKCLYGEGKIWTDMWDFLASFNMPIFYVNPQHQTYNATTKHALNRLKDHAGNFSPSSKEMYASNTFKELCSHKKPMILTSFCQHKVFYDYRSVCNRYPNAILLDNATRPFVLNKLFTHLLFMDDPELEHYRPHCCILKKEYSPTMAQEIIATCNSQKYVIKPINGYKGRGILFVEKEDLDKTLKTILCHDGNILSNQKEVLYWSTNPGQYFLVESLESSQPIWVMNRNYDATMRVAFGISYDKGNIQIHYFGAYWKLPKKPIDAPGSLSDIYLSHIGPGRICSAKVSENTFQEVKNILNTALPKLYLKMLAARHEPGFLQKLHACLKANGSATTLKTTRTAEN